MSKSADNVKFYGELDSAVYHAPKGTTLPTDLSALGAAFADVGWLHEDGIDFDRDTDTQDTPAYQGGSVVKSKTKINKETFKFICLEENLAVLGLAYPGATRTTTAGVTKLVPSGKGSIEICGVVDFVDDEGYTKRVVIVRGDAALTGTVPHKADEPTTYEITVTVYDHFILTDNPAWAGA